MSFCHLLLLLLLLPPILNQLPLPLLLLLLMLLLLSRHLTLLLLSCHLTLLLLLQRSPLDLLQAESSSPWWQSLRMGMAPAGILASQRSPHIDHQVLLQSKVALLHACYCPSEYCCCCYYCQFCCP
jgi:hypothetical protein